MKNKSIVIMFIVIAVIAILVTFRIFSNEESKADTAANALSFGAFMDYEIPSYIIDEIKMDNDMQLCIYLTEADTIGIAYIDCSDIYEYYVIEKRSMAITEIQNGIFNNSQFSYFNRQDVKYSLTSEYVSDSKEYNVVLSDNTDFTFYFSYNQDNL